MKGRGGGEARRGRERFERGREGERLGTSGWRAACMCFTSSGVRCWRAFMWAGPCSPRATAASIQACPCQPPLSQGP